MEALLDRPPSPTLGLAALPEVPTHKVVASVARPKNSATHRGVAPSIALDVVLKSEARSAAMYPSPSDLEGSSLTMPLLDGPRSHKAHASQSETLEPKVDVLTIRRQADALIQERDAAVRKQKAEQMEPYTLLAQAAEHGDTAGALVLAKIYLGTPGNDLFSRYSVLTKNYGLSRKFLLLATKGENESAEAHYFLSQDNALTNKERHAHFMKAFEAGYKPAMMDYANDWVAGANGLTGPSRNDRIKTLYALAEQQYPPALRGMAEAFGSGHWCGRNFGKVSLPEAVKYYSQYVAITQDAEAEQRLASIVRSLKNLKTSGSSQSMNPQRRASNPFVIG